MEAINFVYDKAFLKALDNDINKTYLVKIEILDSNEIPIRVIQGRVQTGSVININGSSSVRRTCNLNIIAEEAENDLTNIDNLFSANKRIKIFEGLKNNVAKEYGLNDFMWFPLGVYIIIQPNITHSNAGCIIQLSCKDKMCLLNGEYSGGLPSSITFDSYDQIIGQQKCDIEPKLEIANPNNYTIYYYVDSETKTHYYSWTQEYSWQEEENNSRVGERVSVPQKIYDIIWTLVCNYGGIDINKIFINDVPLEIKQIVRYTGTQILYYNTATGVYTLDQNDLTSDKVWRSFTYNDEVGYMYTDFTYPGSLVSSIGENICSVLDKIKNVLGNYEYFFDLEGNFVFQEKKNYLNNSYSSVEEFRLDSAKNTSDRLFSGDSVKRKVEISKTQQNSLSILDQTNYLIDFYSNTKSVYTFTEGSGLIVSFSNAPNYSNLKNDFHIWGENTQGYPIHYHVAIKKKPQVNPDSGNFPGRKVIYEQDENSNYTGKIRLVKEGETPSDSNYIPADWRAELYLQGLEVKQKQQRPDIYQQELLDLFDSIYNFKEKVFKADLVYHPNSLQYFFDFLEPNSRIEDCSVDVLGPKVYSYQQDKLDRLYNPNVPDKVILDINMDTAELNDRRDKCSLKGQPISQVSHDIYIQLALGTSGYTAQEVARELLYQYTNYNESISIQSIPIYYLDVNTRITVQDKKSGIYGDYIINSISLPLNASGTMTINASRALDRI